MAWSTLTIDDVALSAPEKAALDAIDASQRVDIVDDEIASARGKIQAGGNLLGPDGTLPDMLFGEVISIIRWRWLITFPKLDRLQTKERQKEAEDAEEIFRQIMRREIKVEVPTTPAPLTPGPIGQVQVASRNRRQFKRRQLRGL